MAELVKALGEAPLAARSWRALPSSVSNILCSRKWATPAGVSCHWPSSRKLHVHAAVVGGKKGVALLKLRPPIHIDVQAVGQLGVIRCSPQCGGILCLPWASPPCLSGNRRCPASASGPPPATCARVTALHPLGQLVGRLGAGRRPPDPASNPPDGSGRPGWSSGCSPPSGGPTPARRL